jgi:hypothetical protein
MVAGCGVREDRSPVWPELREWGRQHRIGPHGPHNREGFSGQAEEFQLDSGEWMGKQIRTGRNRGGQEKGMHQEKE